MKERSRLKTLIQKIFNVTDRSRIKFSTELEDLEYGNLSIKVGENVLFSLNTDESSFCCGIIELGDTVYHNHYNGVRITDMSEEVQNEFYYLCMEQIYRMLSNAVKEEQIKKGLVYWTHIDNNEIVRALKSEFNITGNWKLVNEFFNPNSDNTVCLFTSDINVKKEE